jgi:uncharacterized repeat protein (TIGR02543 family)
MRKFKANRLISALLAFALLTAVMPAVGLAAYTPDEKSASEFYLTADGGPNTIAVTAVGEPEKPVDIPDEIYGGLELYSNYVNLERDYSQSITVNVQNNTFSAVQYYLVAGNQYNDVYLNFVKSGSLDEPLTILPNEKQNVELSLFLQNARRSSYTIPVSAYIITNGVAGTEPESLYNVQFGCNFPGLGAEFTKGAVDASTLATTYTVKNTSGKKVTDFTLSLDGEAADYARIAPGVENYELSGNSSVKVKLIPDLKKMLDNGKEVINGTLRASGGGGTQETDISFDTEGKEITVTTMGELALAQDENPFAGIDFDDSTFSFSTALSGSSVTFDTITGKYYEEGNSLKDGVNTIEEFKEVLDTVIDPETGAIDFTVSDVMTYDGGTMPVSVRVSAEIVEAPKVQLFAETEPVTYNAYYNTDTDTFTAQQQIYLTLDEYSAIVNNIGDAASWLKIVNAPEKIYNFTNPDAGTATKVLFKVDSSINNAALKFLAQYATNADGAIDAAKLGSEWNKLPLQDIRALNKIADATHAKSLANGAKALGNVANGVATGVDVYNTAKVWANPNSDISVGDKLGYTGVQVAKNVNRWVGGKLLSKAGVAIGTAIGDGPGAIVGFFAGYVVSGLIGWGLDKWADSMEDDFASRGALYNDIYGEQCTNAGQINSDFYLPAIVDYAPEEVVMTGRMRDGSPYGGNAGYAEDQFGGYEYQHTKPVSYDLSLNGKPAGTVENAGLTEVLINKLPTGNLQSGRNTLIRRYNTDAGHYKVTADTEITVLYPADTPIAYIGTIEAFEEVRTLPDFAVYSENIYLSEKNAIIGEANKIKVNIYNRGSNGGWTDINVTDGSKTLYTGENVYISSFSAKAVEFEWTPSSENTNITVSLTNKTIDIPERKSDNNSAVRTVVARSRIVPVIGNISPAEAAIQGGEQGVNVSADITKTEDVISASFSIDEDETKYEADLAKNEGGGLRASAYIPISALPTGAHTVHIDVTYKTGAETTAVLKKSGDVNVVDIPGIPFTVDPETILNPTFRIFKLSNGSMSAVSAAVSASVAVDNGYDIAQTKAMYANPEDYYLTVKCDAGVVLTEITELTEPLALAEGNTLTVDKASADSISRIAVTGLNGNYIDIPLAFEGQDSILVSDNITKLSAAVSFAIGGNTSSVTADAAFDDGEAAVSLSGWLLSFTLDAEIRNPQFQALRLDNGYYSYWSGVSAPLLRNGDGYTLIKSSQMVDSPNDFYLRISYGGGLLLIPIESLSGELTADGAKTVTFDKGGADEITGITIKAVNGAKFNDYVEAAELSRLNFSSNVTSVDLEVVYKVGGFFGYLSLTVDLTGENAAVDLNDYNVAYRFGLAEAPAQEYLNGYLLADNNSYYIEVGYDAAEKQLIAVTEAYALEYIKNADKVEFALAVDDTLYCADVTNYTGPIDLDEAKASYAEVTYEVEGEGELSLTDTRVSFDRISWADFWLSGDTHYLPKGGEYTIFTEYKVNNTKLRDGQKVTVSEDTAVTLPNIPEETNATVSFVWPALFSQVQLQYMMPNNIYSPYIFVEKGEKLPVPTGEQTVSASMMIGSYEAENLSFVSVQAPVTAVEAQNVEVTLGNSYSGKASTSSYNESPVKVEAAGKSYVQLYLSDFSDGNGVRLREYYNYNYNSASARPLYVKLILTNKDDPDDFHEIWTDYEMASFYGSLSMLFAMPNVTGEYYYSVELGTSLPNYVIKFETNGGAAVSSTTVTKGAKLSKPANPSKANYTFAGWFTDAELTHEFDFNTPVNGNLTLYAKWSAGAPDTGNNLNRGASVSSSVSQPKVTKNTGGNVKVSSDGKTVTITPDKGYIIKDVIINGESVGAVASYTFEKANSQNTVEVIFEKESENAEGVANFTDVSPTDWFYEAVKYVNEKGLMVGVGEDEFAPAAEITRGMLITIIYRLENPDTNTPPLNFTDVPSGEWFSDAVAWGAANGIINGYGDGQFGPKDVITREQFAAILYRYTQWKNIDTNKTTGIGNYADANEVSNWALPAIDWAVAEGLMMGRSETTLVPLGTATRAEAATLLMRYIEQLLK